MFRGSEERMNVLEVVLGVMFESGIQTDTLSTNAHAPTQAMNRISWFEELSLLDDDSVKVSYETLMRLLETGSSFPASQSVTSKLDHLKQLLATYNKFQKTIEEYEHQKWVKLTKESEFKLNGNII